MDTCYVGSLRFDLPLKRLLLGQGTPLPPQFHLQAKMKKKFVNYLISYVFPAALSKQNAKCENIAINGPHFL